MYGLGLWVPKNPTRLPYLKDSWCIFDLVVVMSGWVDIALEISLTGEPLTPNPNMETLNSKP
jgi:hypothetical protein